MSDRPGYMSELLPDDGELMSHIAAGDRQALAALVERHQFAIRRLAYRHTGRWDVADDVAQETFLRVWRSASAFRGTATFRTWIYRIVVNLCIDWGKRRKLRALPDDFDAPAQTTDSADVVARVQRAIAELPERQRMAVILHRFEGLSHEQIAQSTGWSGSAVESLIVRAYASLRQTLVDAQKPQETSKQVVK